MISVPWTFALLTVPALGLDNGFGRTPVMGFNTYNDVGCSPNQTYMQNTMRSFASKGFADLGYKYFQVTTLVPSSNQSHPC